MYNGEKMIVIDFLYQLGAVEINWKKKKNLLRMTNLLLIDKLDHRLHHRRKNADTLFQPDKLS